ncbi:unnamed protein product, partial [Mesorhabditis belari]|uniref:Fizzy-related protein homolog n=1 Tax=Mesorhabditis belari TaxID=2138241 RepID=A0AAF3FAW5_9BILA
MSSAAEFDRRILGQNVIATLSPVKLITPTNSPHVSPTKRHDYGDRYIPLRQPTADLQARFSAIPVPVPADQETPNTFKRPYAQSSPHTPTPRTSHHYSQYQGYSSNSAPPPGNAEEPRQEQLVHRALLRNELLGDNIDDVRQCLSYGDDIVMPGDRPRDSPSRNLFAFGLKQQTPTKYGDASTSQLYGGILSGPLSEDSKRLLRSPKKPQRKVPKNPYKVLDAPELQDDFYLNLVDWSSQNMLSVGLNTCVYLWSANNSQVIKLCDLSTQDNDSVTSVQWADKGDLLAVGTNKGATQIWDVHTQKKIHELDGHSSRVGCLAWNDQLICSGSRDRSILQRDLRASTAPTRKLTSHRQEVCGLKWSPDRQFLASGGNDNQLLVWNLRRPEPYQTYTEHSAAVKALAWSPHHHGLLVSGGGTADRCLRFWNTLTGQAMQCIDTGSQVCNVAWSKHSSELVSTHGYSYNQVIIWKYPSMTPVTKLTGHNFRVLYLAMSPDGEAIVTGAGDETLRFWHVFSKNGAPRTARSKLNLLHSMR